MVFAEIVFNKILFGNQICFPNAILKPIKAITIPNRVDIPGICIGWQNGRLRKIRINERPFPDKISINSWKEKVETLRDFSSKIARSSSKVLCSIFEHDSFSELRCQIFYLEDSKAACMRSSKAFRISGRAFSSDPASKGGSGSYSMPS